MSRKGFLIAAFFIFQCTFSIAQKVKYKDLIELLNAKQYEIAEPFLKKYLKDNTTNPSAYIYMGIIFQENAAKNDVLKQTDALLTTIDSAIYFYEKASPLLTEKELKRNDENYQMYVRRDPRTAEFVIKLSDVQLDLETRIKDLKEKRDKIKPLKQSFEQSQKHYEQSQILFKEIQSKYATENELLLRSDESLIAELNKLTLVYDSSQRDFKNYKTILKDIGKTGYNQELSIVKIVDFKKDGITPTDFMVNEVKVWDYSGWAQHAIETIQKEIIPLRDQLIAYDVGINKLREKLKKDSVSVRNDLASLANHGLYAELNKFDLNSIPAELFKMKIAELEYHSDLIAHQSLRDSSSVIVRMNCIQSEMISLRKLDSLSNHLFGRSFDTELVNYNHFVTHAYGKVSVLKSLVKTTREYAQREKIRKNAEFAKVNESLRWVIAAPDSIPLFTEASDTRSFKPIVIVNDSFTIGLKYKDSLAVGYLYTITPSRIPDVAANFPIDAPNFKRRSFPILKGLSLEEGSDVYFALIYSQTKVKEGFPATIARVNKTGGLAWAINYKFELTPVELLYSATTNELSIKTTGSDGESKIIVIDQKGKKLQ